MTTLTIGELCAGYGGLGMAVEEVFGARLAWVSEYDAAPSKILEHHWPNVPNHGDMTRIDWAAVEPVDIISGGTPCQDLSHAGKRAGMTEGTRSNLWAQMREAVAVIRPRFVVWENVRGAYSACANSEMGRCARCVDPDSGLPHDPWLRALGRVLGDLSDLGYDAGWYGLTAASVGATHPRFRVFVVATDTRGLPGASGWEPASGQAPKWRPLGDSAGRRGASAAYASSVGRGEGRPESAGLLRGHDAPVSGASPAADTDGAAGGCEQPRRLSPGSAQGVVRETRRGAGRDRGACADDDAQWGQYGPAVARWGAVLGRPAPAPTEASARGAQRLSPRFVEWMMGLPEGHVTDVPGVSRNEQLKALGNGVVPQQAAAAIRHILATTQEAAA